MTPYDFSPLFRSSIGFDRLARLANASLRAHAGGNGYPPYDIVSVGENHFRITLAVAGFDMDDLKIEVQDQTLTVSGTVTESADDDHYLHRGIAERNFIRKFQLADHVEVVDARLENGVLSIDLEREIPEEKMPRTIRIETGAPESLVDKAKKLLKSPMKAKAKAA